MNCIENCLNCKDNTCDKCSPLFYFLNSKCISCKTPNCKECSETDKCSNCNINYFYNKTDHTCKKCLIENCQNCEGNIDSCVKCKKDFLLTTIKDNMLCLKCKIPKCKLCSSLNFCETCEDGFVQVNGTCLLCEGDCKTCPLTKCSNDGCFENFEFNASLKKCTLKKEKVVDCNELNCEKCKLIDSKKTCILCPPSYGLITVLGNKKCVNCKVPNCYNCDDDTTVCKYCSNSYYLKSGKCNFCNVEKCENCGKDPNVCEKCFKTYETVNGKCIVNCHVSL